MITIDQLTEIGCYNKTHGINGEISATFNCDTLLVGELSALISQMDGIFVPFFTTNIRPKTNDTLLLQIEGINTDTQAKKLVNCPIFALTKDMPEQDEVYCDYFIGYTLIDSEAGEIGKIIDIDDTTENALFIVDYNGQNLYIPISEDFIINIDEDAKIIEMELPEGLLSLQ